MKNPWRVFFIGLGLIIVIVLASCNKDAGINNLEKATEKEPNGAPMPPGHGDTTDMKRAVWLDSTNIRNYKGIDIVYSGTLGEPDFVIHTVIAVK